MNKRPIQFIILAMSLALLGIAIIQFYWIKWGLDLNKKNFETKVYSALNQVNSHLSDDASTLSSTKFLKPGLGQQSGRFLNSLKKNSFELGKGNLYMNELHDNYLLFDSKLLFENIIKPKKIDAYIKQAFNNNGVKIKYDYGVWSNVDNDYHITNGSYNVQFEEAEQMSSGTSVEDQLYKAQFEIDLFANEDGESPGSLRVFFPTQATYVWSSIWPWMMSSILFTGLVLFCFIYTIYVILTQKKVSEMRNDFINNMTHEFKTPIATISLAVDSINSPMINSNPEKVKRFSSIIKQENQRMLSQVEKVLQIAVLDKKDFELNISPLDIHALIRRASLHTQLKLDQREGAINLHLDAKNPMIGGDLTHISNVVYNLLDNAIKYSKNKPVINIYTKNKKKGVEIRISDNGIGMTKESLKHIFDKFYRVHTGNLHDVKGFGLGLSYVKAIVDAHGGMIKVKSEPNVGSDFFVYLNTDIQI